ncbi:MAG: hypothetical protein AB7I18_01825 [Candidatus Berkiella sp.]
MLAPRYLSLQLTPTSQNPMAGFQAIREQIAEDPNFTGIYIRVEKGASIQFWQVLKQELHELNNLVKIQHFALGLALDSAPQDFSVLMDLPFWPTLGALTIDGPMSVVCQEQLVNQLATQAQLTILSITTAMFNSAMATKLVRNLPQGVENVDLSWNHIKVDQENAFAAFCQAVSESRLVKLGLDFKGTAECSAMGAMLAILQRKFMLTVQAAPSMSSADLEYFVKAMAANPYLTVDFQDCLSFINDQQKVAALVKLTNQNKTPSLLNLALLRLGELLNEQGIESDEVAAFVPDECISRLTITDALKRDLHQRRQKIYEPLAQAPNAPITDAVEKLTF